jgi:hypothetical protein
MLPEHRIDPSVEASQPLPRRTPGRADLRVFMSNAPPPGRHRPGARSLRVVRTGTGRPVLHSPTRG